MESNSESLQLTETLARALIGAALSAVAALAAHRIRMLSTSGAITATVIGTISIAAGWSWGALLLSMFISASLLSKLGEQRKADRVGRIVEKGAERDWGQVLANGGVFAGAALGSLMATSHAWFAIGAGALAASAADTWATEIGTLWAARPISIISGRRVEPGTSGGISLAGTAAAALGALFIGGVTMIANWPVPFVGVAIGGVAGAMADSLLGATVQERRWCELCKTFTERAIHNCATATSHAGGMVGFDNDAVNAVCSAVGALVALLLS
jgi:uncharacterized protein (TIGR00297 family)